MNTFYRSYIITFKGVHGALFESFISKPFGHKTYIASSKFFHSLMKHDTLLPGENTWIGKLRKFSVTNLFLCKVAGTINCFN